jgi:GT2 family glycosyltransferase
MSAANPARTTSRDAGLLATEIRKRLGPAPEADDWPKVSIVVLNRNGAAHLRRLLAGLIERTEYLALELILVDNASSDESLDFIRAVETPFPISILANPYNESFSDGCNQGAELASGELLLFLNNDVEPFEPGWLRELVACRRQSGAAAVASTLLCSDAEHRASFRYGYGVAHRGLAFREEEGGTLAPMLYGWEADPLDQLLGQDAERGAVGAACLLTERSAFEQVGGFSHGYVYGAEDVDLCFKLRASGHGVLCSGRSLAIHHPVSTRRLAPFEEERARKLANRLLLWERWGPQLRRQYELDRLEARWQWAEEPGAGAEDVGGPAKSVPTRTEVEALGFCLKATESPALGFDAIVNALRRRGHRCLLLEGERVEDPQGLGYDVAVHLRGTARYLPKPAQLNVLWDAGSGVLSAIERSRYHLAFASPIPSALEAERFAQRLLSTVEDCVEVSGYRRRIDGKEDA